MKIELKIIVIRQFKFTLYSLQKVALLKKKKEGHSKTERICLKFAQFKCGQRLLSKLSMPFKTSWYAFLFFKFSINFDSRGIKSIKFPNLEWTYFWKSCFRIPPILKCIQPFSKTFIRYSSEFFSLTDFPELYTHFLYLLQI